MNILQLCAPAGAGGLERVVQGLAIAQHGWRHRVVVPVVVQEALRDHRFLAPLACLGVDVREIVPHRGYLQEPAAVAALCRELRADVVHSHGYRTDIVDCSIVRSLGIATARIATKPTLHLSALAFPSTF